MSLHKIVPEPPPTQLVIPREGLQRVESWISFFKKLSPRVKILLPGDVRFCDFLVNTKNLARELVELNDDEEFIGWPTEEGVAFVVMIDSSNLGTRETVHRLDDIYFFCFGDLAFSAPYFNWDGDPEEDDCSKTYSLRGYSGEALAWTYILSLIIGRVKELEARIPPAP